MPLFQGVDTRTAEIMETEARRLADTLRTRLTWWDNYVPPEKIEMVMSRWGPVSYSGVLVARAVAATTLGGLEGAAFTQALPDHVLLMGLMGGPRMKSPDALHQFPQVLRRTAVMLGALPDGIAEARNGLFLLRAADGTLSLESPHSAAGHGADAVGGPRPLLPGASADAGKLVVPGEEKDRTRVEAQSITLKWKWVA